MNSFIKKLIVGTLTLSLLLPVSGCSLSTGKTEKIKDLEYTVVKESKIPEELFTEIEAKKNECFKLTYSDGQYLYIANGYGAQQTNGYSIQMKEFYLTENAIYFKTELYGPQNGENVSNTESYPYIVIKTEAIDLPIVFE